MDILKNVSKYSKLVGRILYVSKYEKKLIINLFYLFACQTINIVREELELFGALYEITITDVQL